MLLSLKSLEGSWGLSAFLQKLQLMKGTGA